MKLAVALHFMAIRLAMSAGTESSAGVLTGQEAPVEDMSASNTGLNITAMGQSDLDVDEAGFLFKKKKYGSPSTPSSQSWPSSSTHHSSSTSSHSYHHSWSHDSSMSMDTTTPVPPPVLGNSHYGQTGTIKSSPEERCAVYQSARKYDIDLTTEFVEQELKAINDNQKKFMTQQARKPKKSNSIGSAQYQFDTLIDGFNFPNGKPITAVCESACGLLNVCPENCPDIHAIEAFCGMHYEPEETHAPVKPPVSWPGPGWSHTTEKPTMAPTNNPTKHPTHPPSWPAHTEKPTMAPTDNPTKHPTHPPSWPGPPPTPGTVKSAKSPATPGTVKSAKSPSSGDTGWGGKPATLKSGGGYKKYKTSKKKGGWTKYSFSSDMISFSDECGFCVDTCRSDCIAFVGACCPCASAGTILEYSYKDLLDTDIDEIDEAIQLQLPLPLRQVEPIPISPPYYFQYYSTDYANTRPNITPDGIGFQFDIGIKQDKYTEASMMVAYPQSYSYLSRYREDPVKWLYNENAHLSEDHIYFMGGEKDFGQVNGEDAIVRILFKDSVGWHISDMAYLLNQYKSIQAAAPDMKWNSYDPTHNDDSAKTAGTIYSPSSPSFNCITYIGYQISAKARRNWCLTAQDADKKTALNADAVNNAPAADATIVEEQGISNITVVEQDVNIEEQDEEVDEQNINPLCTAGQYKVYMQKFAAEGKTSLSDSDIQ